MLDLEHNNTQKVELIQFIKTTEGAKYNCKLCTAQVSIPVSGESSAFMPAGKVPEICPERRESSTAQHREMTNIPEYFSGSTNGKSRVLIW